MGIAAAVLLCSAPLPAQLSQSRITRTVAVNVDGFVVLADGPGIQSGRFRFPDNIRIDLTRVPLSWTPARAEQDDGAWQTRVRPYFEARFGYLVATERGPSPTNGTPIEIKTRTYGGTAGGGAHIDFARRWTLSIGAALGYAHVTNDLRADPSVLAILEPFRGRLFDWTLETASVLPTASLRHYFPDIGAFETTVTLSATYSGTWVIDEHDDLEHFHTDSGIFGLRAVTEGPIGVSVFGNPIRIRPSVERVQITGDFERGLNVDGWFGFGLDLFARTEGRLPFLSAIGIGGTYEIGDHLEGWSIGIVLDAHF